MINEPDAYIDGRMLGPTEKRPAVRCPGLNNSKETSETINHG
jgi:hypothetical protein